METEEHHNSCAKHIDHALRCTCEREKDWDRRTDRINREMHLDELDSYEDGPIDGYDY